MKKLLLALVVVILLIPLVSAVSDEERAQNVLKKAAGTLDWPASVTEDTENKQTIGTQYYISSDGKGKDSDLRGSIVIFPTDILPGYWLSFFTEQVDFERTTYMGKDAGISHYGKNCNPKPLVKMFNDIFTGWFESIFGPDESDDKGCVTDHGAIIWICKNYLLFASDDRSEEGGQENDIAAAVYAAAQEDGLCEYGDSLVILAGTTDKPGAKKIGEFQKIAQSVNEYYAANSYGKEKFTYTFMDSDGTKGKVDWYDAAPTQAGMSHTALVEAAVKKAFTGTSVPNDLHFKRIIVVYSGSSKQADAANGVFSTADSWKDNNYAIEVPALDRTAKVFSTDLIIVAENDEMGLWAHEIGHSLYSKNMLFGKWNHISDRYNYQEAYGQYGAVWNWDLMGSGNWFGSPEATNPVQMSSFTKESAGWLNYKDLEVNKTYTATAVENEKTGDSAYRFDDPVSNDPKDFYVIEARDASKKYSAPENGLILYKVGYDSVNNHHIVNIVWPQKGDSTFNDTKKAKNPYLRPTMHSAPDAGNTSVEYEDVPGKFKVILEGETAAPYTATFRVVDFNVRNMTGANMTPNKTTVLEPLAGDMATNVEGPKPDLDLHAYDDNGGHVGLNYQTGQYENTIPGAIASGDRQDDEEWIYVPDTVHVRFEVSSYKTQQYFNANPSLAGEEKPQAYSTSLLKVDGEGTHYTADGGSETIGAGQKMATKAPDDPSLKFVEAGTSGFGNNSACPLLPGFLALLAIGVFLRKR